MLSTLTRTSFVKVFAGSSYISMRGMRKSPHANKLPVRKIQKRLDIVILGQPNVGKSVLLNSLVKHTIAATSRKRHTTRSEILGVYNHRNTQLAFYDTPGFTTRMEAKAQSAETLRQITQGAANKADVVLLVVDATRCKGTWYQDSFCEMVKLALSCAKQEVILILNKVDLVEPKVELLDTTRQLVSLINGVKLGPEKRDEAQLDTTTFMISALKDDGLIDVKNYLISIAQTKPWILTHDQGLTDLSIEERIEEMVLQSFLDNIHDEIPYIAEIICGQVEEMGERKVKINVDIVVDTERQKRIVIGQNGRNLVKVRQDTVVELEKIMKKEVILFLWVKLPKDKLSGEVNQINL